MMKTAEIVMNDLNNSRAIKWEELSDGGKWTRAIQAMNIHADQYKQELLELKEQLSKPTFTAEQLLKALSERGINTSVWKGEEGFCNGVAEQFQQLRQLSQELLEAAKEVIRISDRKHDAWDRLKTALTKAEEQLKQK